MKPTLASLFSGCGGGDIGFLQAGFNVIAAYDIDPTAVSLYRNNIGSHIHQQDLSKPNALGHLEGVDVLLASPPCQGFSTIGKRQFDDIRNKLLLSAVEIIAQLKPKLALVENVKGAISGKHLELWEAAEEYLRIHGFDVETDRIDTSSYGIAQTRYRVIMKVVPKGGKIPTLLREDNQSTTTLRDILPSSRETNLSNHCINHLPSGSKDGLIARAISQGQKLCDVRCGERSVHSWNIPSVFGKISNRERTVLEILSRLRRRERKRNYGDADPVDEQILANACEGLWTAAIKEHLLVAQYIRLIDGCIDLKRTFNGKYRRPRYDGPSPTVDTRFGDPKCVLHPIEHRGFTVREAARIQTFPDTYNFSGRAVDMFRVIGNAIPPRLSHLIGQNILLNFSNGIDIG